MNKIIMPLVSRIVLTLTFGLPIIVRFLFSFFPRAGWEKNGNILVVGTFHNPNWFFAHVAPLSKANVGNVVLVTDEVVEDLDNVIYACPPRWVSKIFSRAGAKFLWTIIQGFKYRPDLFMSYHIFPATPIVVIGGALFNRPVCYQATSGSDDVEGGGWKADNNILVGLASASRWIEYLAFRLVKPIDITVVRGKGAELFFKEKVKVIGKLVVQTGSVVIPDRLPTNDERKTDLIYVGQLIGRKRPEWLVEITKELIKSHPNISVNIVGDGEKYQELVDMSESYGLSDNISFLGKRSDVESLLLSSKIFVLTSIWEGVSIAMLEALASGAVPVVANVGDLSSAIYEGKTGFLIEEEVDEFFPVINRLLENTSVCSEISKAGHEWAKENVSRAKVSQNWDNTLNFTIDSASSKSRRSPA